MWFMWLDPEFQFTATTIVSMAARSSNLEDRISGANIQTEGHMDIPSHSQKGPEEMVASGSSPSHLPSWSLARRLLPSHPNTRYCLGIHVTLTEETGVVPPLSHAWTAPLEEDMLHYSRTGFTEAVAMVPGIAVLFYGRHSLAEGLSPGESRDTTFVLTGVGTWVGKPAYLATDPLTIQEVWWEIAWAVAKCWIKARGQGHPCVNLLNPQLFRFYWQGDSPQKDTPRDINSDHQLLPHWPPRGWNHNQCRRDQGLAPLQPPLPCKDHGFESARSLLSMASSMSSLSDRSDNSHCPQQGRWHGEAGAHMKINLPIFKDEDAKDAVTYQSYRWDLMVYCCAGCRVHTLLLYAIWSLQGFPRELVWSLGMDITFDDMLTILDEHYKKGKALDALNQELFKLWMVDKETISDWVVCLLRHLQVLAASFSNWFPPNCVAELKWDCFYGRLPKRLKAMLGYWYVRQCMVLLYIVLDFFKFLGFNMHYISLYGALSLHNCSSSGSLVFAHFGSINKSMH